MVSLVATTTSSCFATSKKPTIVVVGAGLAGLTSAYRLQEKGADVHVYEARNRVGGRIFTAKIGNDIVELGGQNISDGGDAENIHRLINEMHLELKKHRINLSWSYFNGEAFVPESLIRKNEIDPVHLKLQLDQASAKANNMLDVLKDLFTEEDPLYKVLCVRLAAYEGAPPQKLSPLYTNTLYQMLLGGICSAHPGHLNEENYVDIITLNDGNQVLPEKLAEFLGEKVHLNMPLITISKTLEGSYDLMFKNGQKVKADILVLAIPCSVYEDIVFEENVIPKEQLELIKSIKYGSNAKILIPFPKLPSQKTTFIDDRMGCFFADSNVLTLYYTGEAGLFSKNTISEAYLQERPMLESGFGNLCPPLSFPVYAKDECMHCYQGSIGYSWPNDPYVKGTYSYVAPGQEILFTSIYEEDGEKVRALFRPIDHKLFFAGEHASILQEVHGTLEAACESGERTARMIQKSF
jgi:monoamine oxidase